MCPYDFLFLLIDIEYFHSILSGLLGMRKAVQSVRSSVIIMPVVEVKIMQKGSDCQLLLIGSYAKSAVQLQAHLGNSLTVIVGSDTPVLREGPHLADFRMIDIVGK